METHQVLTQCLFQDFAQEGQISSAKNQGGGGPSTNPGGNSVGKANC